jgi:hypothetical protein
VRYPIGFLVDEARLVSERINGLAATQAVLTQMAAATLLDKKAVKPFQVLIRSMTRGEA